MPSSQKTPLPKNWPLNIPYLSEPSYSPFLIPAHISALQTRPEDAITIPQDTPRGPCTLVKITPISAPSHPANGQSGLFTTKDLKPGAFIIQYLGEIHPSSSSHHDESQSHSTSNYDLSLDRDHGLGIDANSKGNEARFINDYRGVAERPNTEFKEIWDERRQERGMGVFVLPQGKKSGIGKKGIKRGEEILVSYGRGFWGARRDNAGG